MKLVYCKKINGVDVDGICDVSVNPPKIYCIVESEGVANDILKSFSDNKAHENRIRILSNLNIRYREKLGLSNEPMDLYLLTI